MWWEFVCLPTFLVSSNMYTVQVLENLKKNCSMHALAIGFIKNGVQNKQPYHIKTHKSLETPVLLNWNLRQIKRSIGQNVIIAFVG